MAKSEDRVLKPTNQIFRRDQDVSWNEIKLIEGKPANPGLKIKVLMITENIRVAKAHRVKGLIDLPHQHDDHESVAVLLSGKLTMKIGDKEFIANPGDVWHHKPGVLHSSDALEESVQIEIKFPPRKTWD